ncbi:MAG: ABC transporter ATP-binding protein [Dehalococcoidales bacterium]
MALLEVKKLSKYFGGLAALSDFDMAVEEGEIRGLIGPNGSGKTTFYNVISGVYGPTSGTVVYNGVDISHLPPSEIAKMGLVRTFQQTALFMDFTVLQNISVGRHLHSGESVFGVMGSTPGTRRVEKEALKKAEEIVDFMELTDIKDELAVNLPHGYMRALGVGIALATEPKMLMLDEPVTGMNPTEKAHMLALIKRIQKQGITVLIVEHDMKTVMGLCDYITVLSFGKKLAEGKPKEIISNEAVIEAYLGKADILG